MGRCGSWPSIWALHLGIVMSRSTWQRVIGTLAVCALATTPAVANLPPADHFFASSPLHLGLGPRMLEPFAEVIFCHQNPAECTPGNGISQVEMTRVLMAQLMSVNRRVNRAITPKEDDPNIMGGNVWRLAPAEGDCKDYAITKRHELIQQGLPTGALRLAVVHTPTGEGHMVLVVTTSSGDLVLDNLTGEIRHWQDARMTWEMIQSAENPRQWHKVAPGAETVGRVPVAAVKRVGNVKDFL